MKGTPTQNIVLNPKYSQCEYLAKTLVKQVKSCKTQDTCTRVRDAVLEVTSAPMGIQLCQCRTFVKVNMNMEMNRQIGIESKQYFSSSANSKQNYDF